MAAPLERALELARLRGYEAEAGGVGDFPTVVAPRDSFKAYLFELKQGGFRLLSDLLGLDYLEYTAITPERFAVVYNLFDPKTFDRVLVKVYVPDGEKLPTVTDLWGTANFHEREVFDLFDIEFEGHPDLRKILTPEDLDGHALRKDFPLGETPTLFREGRFLDPAAFRAGLAGRDPGLSGWRGGARRDSSDDREPPTGPTPGVAKPEAGRKG